MSVADVVTYPNGSEEFIERDGLVAISVEVGYQRFNLIVVEVDAVRHQAVGELLSIQLPVLVVVQDLEHSFKASDREAASFNEESLEIGDKSFSVIRDSWEFHWLCGSWVAGSSHHPDVLVLNWLLNQFNDLLADLLVVQCLSLVLDGDLLGRDLVLSAKLVLVLDVVI